LIKFINYWKFSKTPLYSFLFTLPYFIFYEIGIIFTSQDDLIVIRNGADALMRQALSRFGLIGLYWLGVVFFIVFIAIFIFQKKKWKESVIVGNYFFIMTLESCFWSYILFLLMSNMNILLMNPNVELLVQQITLAIGAGIYEEFFFRVVLITIISSILTMIFKWSKNNISIIAIIISAGIFSAFHFLGEFGDFFTFKVFMVRFLAGIFLGILYLFRGFGITAWSHSIYDLIILTKITTE
jgi:membrane protease YdiL (CAAX protease family)